MPTVPTRLLVNPLVTHTYKFKILSGTRSLYRTTQGSGLPVRFNVRRDIVDERVYSNEQNHFEQIYMLF